MSSEGAQVPTTVSTILSSVNQLASDITFRDRTFALRTEGFDYVLTEANAISQLSEYFSSGALSVEIARFAWLWLQIVVTGVSFFLCLRGYYGLGRRRRFLLGGSVMLFILLLLLFVYLAYVSSEMFLTLDMCEQIYTIVHKNQLPYVPRGIATYLPPFTYVSLLLYRRQ